ncbi:MAG: hypothetical protein CR972_00090 [Candidatus Moraniibacteriota bacterium]|nr:MAG: hypothetical protein CR972_00090 [Candidatus Moranbacteria bacterium]
MKNLYLIKLGKAWHVIKRDGILKASRRIIDGVVTSLRPVGSGDVLFISGGVGDSALYRTTHVAEELEFQGIACSVTVQDNPFLDKYVDKFSVFIFHRTLYTDSIVEMIEKIKKVQKTIIFETDDLVYDPKYLHHMDYYKKMNVLEKKLYENGVGGEILRDDYVKIATTTTHFLSDKLKEFNKTVFIVPNRLSVKDVTYAQSALREKRNNEKEVRLGYFSGTISHNKDFATITDALVRIMEKYGYVRLFLVGPLDIDNILVQKFSKRIVQLPYVPRKKHFVNIAQCDINLAPLERNNPFCEAKSELKFFEAGIVKVPTVAVANHTFSQVIVDGVDGYVASGKEEWVEKLSQLIEDRDMRQNIGEKAYQKVLQQYTTQNAKNISYYNFIKEKI